MYNTIKRLAKEKGMSVINLEEKAGLARSSICKWNKSSPTLESLAKVANALEIPVTDIIATIENQK